MTFRATALAFALCCASIVRAAPEAPAHAQDDIGLADAAKLVLAEAGAHRLLLLGELHGTKEAPKLVELLASAYAAEGPVLVGLELGESVAAAIDTYLASDGSTQARLALLSAPYWHVPLEKSDGRRNLEAIGLIEHLRSLKARGRDISVLAFDTASPGSTDSAARDKAMAGRIREAFEKLPRGRLISLSGNVHAMLEKPGYAPPEMQTPMGSYLRDLDPWSVNIRARGGQYWGCGAGPCGRVDLSPEWRDSRASNDGAFHYQLVLPHFTAARLIEPLPHSR